MSIEIRSLHGKDYKVIPQKDGLPVAFHVETPDSMIHILIHHWAMGTRLRFHWGNIETGEDWGDVYDVEGHIGMCRDSEARYPILIHNARSIGGGLILTQCIVKITLSKGKKPIYVHPNYHTKEYETQTH